MARFHTLDTQNIQVYFTVRNNIDFSPEIYITSDSLVDNIAQAVIDSADGDIVDWEVFDHDVDDTTLLTNTEYRIVIRAEISCDGTCYYDPGQCYGPVENCYPPEIDDVVYEEGEITGVDEQAVLATVPEIADIRIVVDEPDYEGELEIASDDYGDDYY